MAFPSGKLTQEDIEAKIASVEYIRPEGTTLTICLIKTVSGFVVTGESACVSPDDFDEALGQSIARKEAFGKLWMLEGYLRLNDELINAAIEYNNYLIETRALLTEEGVVVQVPYVTYYIPTPDEGEIFVEPAEIDPDNPFKVFSTTARIKTFFSIVKSFF